MSHASGGSYSSNLISQIELQELWGLLLIVDEPIASKIINNTPQQSYSGAISSDLFYKINKSYATQILENRNQMLTELRESIFNDRNQSTQLRRSAAKHHFCCQFKFSTYLKKDLIEKFTNEEMELLIGANDLNPFVHYVVCETLANRNADRLLKNEAKSLLDKKIEKLNKTDRDLFFFQKRLYIASKKIKIEIETNPSTWKPHRSDLFGTGNYDGLSEIDIYFKISQNIQSTNQRERISIWLEENIRISEEGDFQETDFDTAQKKLFVLAENVETIQRHVFLIKESIKMFGLVIVILSIIVTGWIAFQSAVGIMRILSK